jgi:hypothetical protein
MPAADQPESQPKKIIVDDDWKERVQAEKEQLRRQQEAQPETAKPAGSERSAATRQPPAPEQYPAASFSLLVSTLATQTLFCLGQLADAQAGAPQVDLQAARHHIDMLAVLEEKTRGNLSPDEAASLENVLHELRMLYVAVGRMAASQNKPASG